MVSDITFKETIFVYSLEYHKYTPSNLKVAIPEVFLTNKTISPKEFKVSKGNDNIFVNSIPPALSQYSTKYNYVSVPIIGNVSGSINIGDRFICNFVNDNPSYGYIIARC